MTDRYVVYTLKCTDDVREAAIAELAEVGFEGFVENESSFTAYIRESDMDEVAFNEIIGRYAIHEADIRKELLDDRNWNEEWEKSFEPVVVKDSVIVRAPFHTIASSYTHELIIQPKNTFGTGHHETTQLMIGLMLDEDWTGKKVLDYGTGTGVLGILARRLGAASVLGIDIDAWSADNISENVGLNKITDFIFRHGDLSVVSETGFGIVLANINRNILLRSFEALAQLMEENGHLLISGFYESDLEALRTEALKHNLHVQHHEANNAWCAARLKLFRPAL